MVRPQHRRLEAPAEVRKFPLGKVEIYEIGDAVVGRQIFEPGWRWSESVGPIAGTRSCEYHHMGYSFQGTVRITLDDGSTYDIQAGEAYEIPPGHDALVISDDAWIAIDWAGMRSFARPVVGSGERILSTILFTDIVDSTAIAERMGDAAWRDRLGQYYERGRYELDRYRGREIDTTGDGFLALFDGTERGVRAAAGICLAAKAIGIETRAGLHTGEIEMVPGNVRGVAVHMAARIMALAGPSEVLISGTTHDLLAGSDLEFEDRGPHELKGISGARQVFALTSLGGG